jgi:hypothetical protein
MIQRSPDELDRKFQGFGFKNAAYAVLGGLSCIISRNVEVIRVVKLIYKASYYAVSQSSYRSKSTKGRNLNQSA